MRSTSRGDVIYGFTLESKQVCAETADLLLWDTAMRVETIVYLLPSELKRAEVKIHLRGRFLKKEP